MFVYLGVSAAALARGSPQHGSPGPARLGFDSNTFNDLTRNSWPSSLTHFWKEILLLL